MLLDDVEQLLQNAGINVPIYKGRLPDTPEIPDTAIGLYQYTGLPPDLAAPIDYPGLQVRLRHTDFAAAMALWPQIQAALHGVAELDVTTKGTTTHYMLISADQSPIPLGQDEKQRWEWTQNYSTMIRRA